MEAKNLEVLPLDFDRMNAELFVLIEFLEKVEGKGVDSGQWAVDSGQNGPSMLGKFLIRDLKIGDRGGPGE